MSDQSPEERRRRVSDDGRPEAVARQHARGKLTARERIATLADSDSFREVGALVGAEAENAEAPADGVITGTALVEGRPVSLVAFDFTVFGGSNGRVGRLKVNHQAQLALDHGMPFVMLLEGGGHRIQEGLDSRHFASGSRFFQIEASLSGWVPVAAAVLGPGFAGPSNYCALADFVVMVRGASTMGVAGPALVRAATGESLSQEELGGAAMQADACGIADLAVATEADALAAIRRFLGYFPGNAEVQPPIVATDDSATRRDERLAGAVPDNPRRAYDVRVVVDALADAGSVLELKPTYARNLVTALARLDGRPMGAIANQPLHLGGALDSAACEKGAHFIALCDAFGLPLVSLIDVPGFLVGASAERSGLARRSGRLLYELGQATVPRIAVVLRKGYGLGYIAMGGGRSFDADLCVAWPTAEICAMSVEGAVDVAYRAEVEAAPDAAARRAELIAGFRAQLGAARAAEGFGIDDVIDPRDTRPVLIDALRRLAPRRRRAARGTRPISPI